MEDEVVYYLEQVTTQYGYKTACQQTNDKIGFEHNTCFETSKQEINIKQTDTEFLNDLKQIPQVYAQSVYRHQSDTNSISETT